MRRNTKGAWFGSFSKFDGIFLLVGLIVGFRSVLHEPRTQDSERVTWEAERGPSQASNAGSENTNPPNSDSEARVAPPESKGEAELLARLRATPLGELRAALGSREDKRFDVSRKLMPRLKPRDPGHVPPGPEEWNGYRAILGGTVEYMAGDRLIVMNLKRARMESSSTWEEARHQEEKGAFHLPGVRFDYEIKSIEKNKEPGNPKPDASGTIWARLNSRDGKRWLSGELHHPRVHEFGYTLFVELPVANEVGRFEIVLDENGREVKSGLVRWRLIDGEVSQ